MEVACSKSGYACAGGIGICVTMCAYVYSDSVKYLYVHCVDMCAL